MTMCGDTARGAKTAAVVGGGITGCATALDLARLGFQVTLYEAKPLLGGILRDLESDGKWYFNGCQYLRTEQAWHKALPETLQASLYRFEHYQGSYTDLGFGPVSHEDFESPVFDAPPDGLADLETYRARASLADRMRCYPPAIGEAVLGWLRHLGADPEAIDAGNAYYVQLGRLYLRGDDKEIDVLKANSPVAGDLLGLPRTVRGEGRPIGSLPVNGYNAFFDVFESVLTEAGVAIHKGRPVVPRFENDTVILRLRGEALRPDLIVWAANPTPVIAAAGLGRLDDPFVDITVSAGNISGSGLPSYPHYMQVYSTGSPVTRIFSYPREGGQCVTVEHMPDKRDLPDLQTHVQEICRSFYGDVRIEIAVQQPQRRHIFFSPADRARFDAFRGLCTTRYVNFVDGAWESYARDPKINGIASTLRSRLSLLSS
ncbi:FAD-dependent oxidoreductase [Nisaea sp.]|uniref:FAD-dependent oxidoreductase n=1 Tax=Nisaea sp. TaxID=2024842 RepID=UPI0032995316